MLNDELPNCFFLPRKNASPKVIGIMASVRVSFTITAFSSVAPPRCHILSHVEEVSFTAVPANTPKASPFAVLMPIALPKIGNKIAASTLKKNMTEIACATSSSSASMTGAVAATAEPPQIDDPTPINVEILDSMCITLCKIHATTSDVLIVQMIIGNDCFPVCKITPRFMPNPRSTTAVCKIVFDVHLMPASALPFSFQNKVRIIPRRMAKMAPPTIGNIFPRSQEGTAIARQTKIPAPFCFIKFMVLPLFSF